MKKRVLSALLSLVLAVSLIGGMTVTASADSATITYTLKAGDTVGKVCADLGIDFARNYDWITTTNNITNYSGLPVGKVLILPAPGTIATSAPASAGPGGVTPTTTTTTTTTVAATPNPLGTVPAATASDPVSSYLISHTLKSGETVYSVCNSYGVKFDANTVSRLNNITSYTSLKVGQVLLLPSANPPASGNYYKILAHKVVSGDTVVKICSANGIEYGKNIELLKILNNKNDLTSIKVGETFYVPVPATAAGGVVPAGTTTSTTGGAPANGGSTVPTGTTPSTTVPTIQYTMKAGDTVAKVCQTLGIDFYKNYEWITATNKIQNYSKVYVGQVLTLPAPGTVATAGAAPANGGSTTPTGTGTATTPTTVTPSAGGAYSLHTSSNGTYVLQVNGQLVNTANQGQTVTIVPIPDFGYTLESISVTKTGAADRVAVTNNSFVMPGYPVSIVVTFKPAG